MVITMSELVSTPGKKVTSVRLPPELLDAIDTLVDAGYFSSRSEFFHEATILLLEIATGVNNATLHALEVIKENPPQPATPNRLKAILTEKAWSYLLKKPPEFELIISAEDVLLSKAVDTALERPNIIELASSVLTKTLQEYFKEIENIGEDLSELVSTPENHQDSDPHEEVLQK